MKLIINTLALLLYALHLTGQPIALGDPVPRSDTALNVAVGQHSVMACYPAFDFVLDHTHMKLRVCFLDEQGQPQTQSLDAVVTPTGKGTWRADVNPGTWVEVSIAEGWTVVHQNCRTWLYTRTAHPLTLSR